MLWTAALLAVAWECPQYSTIRQPSVDPKSFSIDEISGVWYLVATTEPTTRFCLCNVMNYSIYTSTYRYTDTCYQDLSKRRTNVTLTIGGDLSYDPSSPGILHEGFVLLNHTVTSKKPNMLFNVSRDSLGKVEFMHFYACLGTLVPVVGKPLFSYLLYSRSPWLSDAQIDELVLHDNATGYFDTKGYVRTNSSTWGACSVV